MNSSIFHQFKDCLFLLDSKSRVQFSLLALMMIVGAGLELLSIGLILPFLQLIDDPSRASTVPILGMLMERIGGIEQNHLLIYAGLGFLTVVFVKNAFFIVLVYCQYRLAYHNQWLLSQRLYLYYLESPFVHAMKRNSAELIRNVSETVQIVINFVLLGFVNFLTELMVALAITALLLALQPVAALSAGAILALAVGSYHVIAGQKFVSWGEKSLSLHKDRLQSLQQGLNSLKTTKVHGREDYFHSDFSKTSRTLSKLGALINTANNTPRLWVETIFAASVLVVIMVLTSNTTGSGDVFPVLGLFAVAAFRLIPSVNRIIIAINNIKHGSSALEIVVRDTVLQLSHSQEIKATDDEIDLGPIKSIRLENVSFTYPETNAPAIDDICLEIKPGKSLGLVGPSGAGKTTVVDILLGLLTPTKGRVLINGKDLTTVLGSWRKRLGYVPQFVYILDDTLRRNIAFGFPDEIIRDDDIWAAMRLAQLEDFGESLPDGLDTVLGEHGARLSGGQQQRVGIARALYHDPEILVLDEATSSLDNEIELEITNAIENLKGQKTLVVIAHRLSTVRKCDSLVFLQDGRISGTGKFEELTASNETFRNLGKLAEL